ncbi:MAG: acyl-CoA dehydrogenase family protein [Anaerolineae bacterium]|jgi:acyl-CoA dehydrogenase|nr:acyl-CoA dehydrogenase family protein [Anaerolineae bacterium]
MDFTIPPPVQQLARRVQQFVEEVVLPVEKRVLAGAELTKNDVFALRAQARAAGLFAPTMPVHLGGLGLSIPEWVPVLEAAGRSLIGPLALHCAAPDEGNMHTLHLYASPEQVEQYLRPLVAGEVFSGFSMTEPPPGAGSDPTMIQTTAVREGDTWVLNGHKWYTTNGTVADFLLIFARTRQDVSPYKGCSIFLAPVTTPGIHIVRDVPTIGRHDFGGHVEIRYEEVRLPHSALLGEEGAGFGITQARLGPARLTHCMRWTGIAQRALEIAAGYAATREAFGKKLMEHQSVGFMLADSEMELHAGRLLMHQAAWLLHQGDQARAEAAMTKVFVSEAVNRIIDRAIQICGGTGISRDLPLSTWYESARAFRIYDGASEVHRMVAARQVIKKYAAPPPH